jgi:hypothetical protein
MEKWDDSICIGDIFYRMAVLFKVYGDYAVNADEVGQFLESSEYNRFLTRCKASHPYSSETLQFADNASSTGTEVYPAERGDQGHSCESFGP